MENSGLSPHEAEQLVKVLPEVTAISPPEMTEVRAGMILAWVEVHNPALQLAVKDASRQIYISVLANSDIAKDERGNLVLTDYQLRGLIAQAAFAGAASAIEKISGALSEVNNLKNLFAPSVTPEA
ncbi:MAG: hypothetical protein ACR2FM_03440 [Candidatus Saccharimonadales bacterium]